MLKNIFFMFSILVLAACSAEAKVEQAHENHSGEIGIGDVFTSDNEKDDPLNPFIEAVKGTYLYSYNHITGVKSRVGRFSLDGKIFLYDLDKSKTIPHENFPVGVYKYAGLTNANIMMPHSPLPAIKYVSIMSSNNFILLYKPSIPTLPGEDGNDGDYIAHSFGIHNRGDGLFVGELPRNMYISTNRAGLY
ncbi:MAG: hypothetical protein ACRCVW_00755 [Brevinema sp.]